MTKAEEYFRGIAPPYMQKFMDDFSLGIDDAAAVFGNLGHESLGFTTLQEMKPLVPGSLGGYGWAQWTGPRRREYEAYCKRTGKNAAAHDTNYAFLFVELKGSEKTALAKLRAANGLEAKTIAFERAFLRAGIKHDDKRLAWARIAREAYTDWRSGKRPVGEDEDILDPITKDSGAKRFGIGIVAAAVVVIAAIILVGIARTSGVF